MTTTETRSSVKYTDMAAPHTRSRANRLYSRFGKRIFDVTVASSVLVVMAPFLLIVAVLNRWFLGSPTLYRQERVGRAGRTFVMLKFRSMRPSRRVESAPIHHEDRRGTHKCVTDPRHTRYGRLIRKSSVDELPQLVNVLRGNMSLVGPRPELPHIAEMHGLIEHERHTVRPGLTGLWQISSDRPGFVHENVRYDIEYLQTMSFRQDVSIILRTIPVLLRLGGL